MNYDEIMRRADEELERQFKAGTISRRVYEGTKSGTPYRGTELRGVEQKYREDDGPPRQELERGSISRRGPPEAGERSRGESSTVTPATPEPASVSSTTSIPKQETKPKKADRPSGETVTAPVQAMLKHGSAYVDAGHDYYEERYRSRVVQNMKRKAQELGYQLIEISGLQQKTATT